MVVRFATVHADWSSCVETTEVVSHNVTLVPESFVWDVGDSIFEEPDFDDVGREVRYRSASRQASEGAA